PLPTLSKTAVGYAAGSAHWTLKIDNTAANAIDRDVTITDAGVTVVPIPAACSGNITTGMDCHVLANTILSLEVYKAVPQQCTPTQASNSASAVIKGTNTNLNGSPTGAV